MSKRRILSLLSQKQAVKVDQELMGKHKFSIDQLMELAGLSVASALHDVWVNDKKQTQRILIACGPGNNGGDGLVAARHLSHFGKCQVDVWYPRRQTTKNPLYLSLLQQCEDLKVPILENDFPNKTEVAMKYDVIVDAVFGFSFDASRAVRAPFDVCLNTICNVPNNVLVCAVDIPSGWHVENGDINNTGYQPDMLMSLTAPKQCAIYCQPNTIHYVGGRFVPPSLIEEMNLVLPEYPKQAQHVRIEFNEKNAVTAANI